MIPSSRLQPLQILSFLQFSEHSQHKKCRVLLDVRGQSEWRPNFGVLGKRKSLLRHADHRVHLFVEGHCPPDYRGVFGETRTPKRIVDHHHSVLSLLLIFVAQQPSLLCPGPQQFKKSIGNTGNLQNRRLTRSRQRFFCLPPGCRVLQRVNLGANLLKRRPRETQRERWKHRVFGVKRDNSRRILVRQRPQNHRIHNAEDRRVRTNSQRQRDHRNGGKCRILPQYARAKTQILPKRFQ